MVSYSEIKFWVRIIIEYMCNESFKYDCGCFIE